MPPAPIARQDDALTKKKEGLLAAIKKSDDELDKHGPATRGRHLPELASIRSKAESAATAEDLVKVELRLEAWQRGLLAELFPGLQSAPSGTASVFPKQEGSVAERLKARVGDGRDPASLTRLFDNAAKQQGSVTVAVSQAPEAPAPTAADPLSAERARFIEVEKLLRKRGASQRVIDLTIAEAARQKADPLLVLAMVQAESNFKPGAVSHCGARGLMQLIPSTAKDMGVSDPDALFDPRTNLRAGIKYLKWLWGRFANQSFSDLFQSEFSVNALAQKTVAAYNAGPGNVAKYGGIPPFKETRRYVAKIVETYGVLRDAFLSAF
ncbi:MAG: lytic transglycosylase domain-containing protein [Elusimicrobia bacterium]|nr:lytic transglycosylase domain-containing protein [Elusimicrobiota bacterium]